MHHGLLTRVFLTLGVMVIAKTENAHWSLYEQFARRSTDKRYLALVHGQVTSEPPKKSACWCTPEYTCLMGACMYLTSVCVCFIHQVEFRILGHWCASTFAVNICVQAHKLVAVCVQVYFLVKIRMQVYFLSNFDVQMHFLVNVGVQAH